MAVQAGVNLFLLGKTGVGKSSTGNAILGQGAFPVWDSLEPQTFSVQASSGRREGRLLTVVDLPGVADTRMTNEQVEEAWMTNIREGMAKCPSGFHALILVLKYGERFTQEQTDTIDLLKSNFGESFLRDVCILVFTHGEQFDLNYQSKPSMTFEEWCGNQSGGLRQLVDECGHRVVLFRNTEKRQWTPQLNKLLKLVDGLASRGMHYTHDMFARITREREELIAKRERAEKMLRKDIQLKIDLLADGLDKVQRLDLTKSTNPEADLNQVKRLKDEARQLYVEIWQRDNNTGVLQDFIDVVGQMQRRIEDQDAFMKDDRHKRIVENAKKELQKKYDRELENYRQGGDKDGNRGWRSFLNGATKFVVLVCAVVVVHRLYKYYFYA